MTLEEFNIMMRNKIKQIEKKEKVVIDEKSFYFGWGEAMKHSNSQFVKSSKGEKKNA